MNQPFKAGVVSQIFCLGFKFLKCAALSLFTNVLSIFPVTDIKQPNKWLDFKQVF